MDIFWNIKGVSNYERLYGSGITENTCFHRNYELVKNLSYNSQYLEFLDKAIKEDIHVTLKTEFIKTFVIIGISIVESVLYYFIKSEGLQKKEEFEEITTMNSNEKKVDETILKVETTIFRKLEKPKEVEMNFDSMLKKIEGKKLFGDDHTVYSELNRLRKLRNKIHLYAIEEKLDHDFNNFNTKEVNMMKKSLIKIMYSEKFKLNTKEKDIILDFLK